MENPDLSINGLIRLNKSYVKDAAKNCTQAHQGKGYLSRLLRPVLDDLDKKKISCVLETPGEPNASIYRHFGLTVLKEATITKDKVKMWPMLREPVPR